ncbi:tRNA (adenine(58)-N(1))-methyltransferase non-catalytic subunit TRM6-like isoform X2 [Mercenaria mercenaria]|nr:tRNA (adenine(58)-N(1))-methyltransferase non-catalytic subunit TRM6-like isoform X2 [Mercenaria mercenaria]
MVKMERTVEQDADITAEGKDNRHLLDKDSNQKLKQEEIEQMKKEGVSRDHLIEQLIENSATFHGKTGYAQEKWVKKKKKKHLLQFTVLKPTTRLLCEMHWSKGPSRICNLRIDTLAQILTMGNIHANSTVMVVESCLGLVTGAVLERLGGFGKVISFYHGDTPVKHHLDNYDFSAEIMGTLYNYPLELVNSLKHTKPDQQSNDHAPSTAESCDQSESIQTGDKTVPQSYSNNDSANSGEQTNSSQTGSIETLSREETVPDKIEPFGNQSQIQTVSEIDSEIAEAWNKGSKGSRWAKKKNKPQKNRAEAKLNRAKEIEEARKIILEKNVDCLIVASKFYPTDILLALIDYVAPSRQVVVFSQFKEALEDCYAHLREHKGLVSYRLTETWLREYQVLPNRTHPVIQMSGTGGYLVTATTVIKEDT